MRLFLFILTVLVPQLLLSQYEKDYTPLVSQAAIPPAFIENPIEATKKNVENSQALGKKEATAFYSQMNFIKYQLFQSGQIYLPNPVTYYIDSIVTGLLVTEPKLQGHVKVYLTRFTQSNAFCFPDGTIFINIGLLARIENKSELAFILSHEIAHYAEQHNIKDLKRLAEIKKQEYNFNNKNSSAYRSLKFSRESEFDADSWATQLVAQAGYNTTEAVKALERIRSMESLPASIDFKPLFESDNFSIDTSWINAKAVKRNKSYYTEKDSDPITSGKLNDLFQTHPDLDKRTEAVAVIARTMKNKKEAPMLGKQSYLHIQELAAFEVVENNYQEQDYLNCILNAAHLLKKYPDNTYLHMSIGRSLYWLSYFKELKTNNEIIKGNAEENGYDFYKLYSLVSEMGLKDAKKLAYASVLKKYELYPEKESLLFYLALSTDNYLGLNAARNYYKDYLVKYPNGHYINVTKSKLQ